MSDSQEKKREIYEAWVQSKFKVMFVHEENIERKVKNKNLAEVFPEWPGGHRLEYVDEDSGTWTLLEPATVSNDLKDPPTFRAIKDDQHAAASGVKAELESMLKKEEERHEQNWIRTDDDPIMVRECYKELFDLMKEDMTKQTTILITGTPGIGKSNFGYYIMWRLLQKKNCSFIFEQSTLRVVLCTKTGDITKYDSASRQSAVDKGWFDKGTDCIYIADLREHVEPECAPNMCTIICSSPNPTRYKEAMKKKAGESHHEYRKYFMPLWTDKEMSSLLKLLVAQIETEDEKKFFLAEKEERMRKAGNVPRHLFNEDAVRLALARFKDKAEDLIATFEQEQTKDENVTYKLIHVQASSDYKTSRLTWASEYVLDRLVENSSNKLVATLQNLVNESHMPELQTLRGILYERCIHQMFRKQLECKATLLDGKESCINIPYFQAQYAFRSNEVVTDKPDTYLQPIASNQESIDSLSYQIVTQVVPATQTGSSQGKRKREYVPSQRKKNKKEKVTEKALVHLWLFQITVTNKHPVKWNGINRILSKLKAVYEVRKIYLVFVFPKQMKDFAAQSYLDSEGLVRDLPKNVKITQCKCPLDISLPPKSK